MARLVAGDADVDADAEVDTGIVAEEMDTFGG